MALREKGYSYRQIAKELDCSLFKVSQLISDVEQPESRLKKLVEIDGRIKNLNSNLNSLADSVADINRKMPNIQHVESILEHFSKAEECIKKEEEAIKTRGSYYKAVQEINTIYKYIDRINALINWFQLDIEFIEEIAKLKVSGEFKCANMDEGGDCKKIKIERYNVKNDISKGKYTITNMQSFPIFCLGCPAYERKLIDNTEVTDKNSQSSTT